MRAIRAGLYRYLKKENINFSITGIINWQRVDSLNAHLVELAREGKISSTKHKPTLISQDVEILRTKSSSLG